MVEMIAATRVTNMHKDPQRKLLLLLGQATKRRHSNIRHNRMYSCVYCHCPQCGLVLMQDHLGAECGRPDTATVMQIGELFEPGEPCECKVLDESWQYYTCAELINTMNYTCAADYCPTCPYAGWCDKQCGFGACAKARVAIA